MITQNNATLKNLAILLALNTLALIFILDLPNFDIYMPIHFHSDLDAAVGVFKMITSGDFPWYLYPHTDTLSQPFGLSFGDYPLPMFLDWVFIRFLGLFISDPFAVYNTFILSSFFFVPLASYYVLRKFRIDPMIAIVISLLFNYIPYHMLRADHYLYVGYFFIPLWTYYLLLLWNKKPLFFKRKATDNKYAFDLSKKNIFIMLLLLLSATWNYYYSFFFVFLIIVSALSAWTYNKNRYMLYSSAIMIFLIIVPVGANMMPYIIHKHQHGKNEAVGQRPVKDSEIYGLKIAQLLLPVDDHRIKSWSDTKAKYNKGPLNNENSMATLGVVGSIGFLILLVLILMRRKNSTLSRLTILNTSAIMLATIGGLSSLVALLATSQIRGYNRISPFIAFFALLAVALLINRFSHKYHMKKVLLYPFLILLLIFGLYDQSNKEMILSQKSEDIALVASDRDFIRAIEQNLSNVKEPKIMQYPYISFPEGPYIGKVKHYDQMIGYIYGDRLKWSYGAVKGRESDRWLSALVRTEPLKQIAILKSSGFSGIYIDRRGYKDRAASLEKIFSKLSKNKAMVSGDRTKSFFRITPTGDMPYVFD